MNKRYPLHIHISTLFVLLTLAVGGTIGWLGYQHGRHLLESAADDMTKRINRETVGEVNRLVAPAEMAVSLLRFERLTTAASLDERLPYVGFLREALRTSRALTALYVGYPNGDFFLFRRFVDDDERMLFAAPAGSAYVVQSIERAMSPARGRYLFLDDNLLTLRVEDRPDYPDGFDPRQRVWYRQAASSADQVKTRPYVFFSNRRVGTTLAAKAANGNSVVGADILLETLGETLARQKVTPSSAVLLVNADGHAVAYENLTRLVHLSPQPGATPTLAKLDQLGAPILAKAMTQIPRGSEVAVQAHIAHEGDRWRVNVAPLVLKGSEPIYLLTAIPDSELLAAAQTMIERSALVTLLIICLSIPVTWLLARNISGSIGQLEREAEAIRHFEFSRPIETRSLIREVDELAKTMDGMKRTIQRFLDVSRAVAGEDDFDRLLPRLLDETMAAADAFLGVLYLADQGTLRPASARQRQDEVRVAVEAGFAAVAEDDRETLLGRALGEGVALGGPLPAQEIWALGLAPAIGEARVGAIAVPLLNRQRQTVGALLLLCPDAVDPALVNFIGALSGSAAVTLEARELIKAQKALFEALIKLIAGAIDAKSAYTGGHCARVPEIAKMLAEAACAESSGRWRDFALDENGREALHIAAWLHDCGKITTPDHVVDKATKLETIYDRIHEIRMRFEVLKRDAEIACLRAIAAGEDRTAAQARLAEQWRLLDDEFAFVAACNEGGEAMKPEHIERLRTIASRVWMRTLDDRLGISHEEKAHRSAFPAPSLPTPEPLLADKPEHRIPRPACEQTAADNPWGFRLAVPELLYHRGELHNLSVGRGTLTDEERYKINEHIVQTIVMLSQLPFPKHLRGVPELAGGHHEKMDGTGYPRRLRGEDMSTLARIMAIADIFEALTAADRPYKPGKKLTEAVALMARMKDDGHIDPDLFDLFLSAGIHRAYADRHMRPEQIDEVDVSLYVQPKALA